MKLIKIRLLDFYESLILFPAMFAFLGLLLLPLLFANNYLHLVDSGKAFICEVLNIAKQTSTYLLGSNLKTPKADKFLDNLMVDENKNVKATFDVNGEEYTLNLNPKLTGRGITLTTRNKLFV